MLYFVRLSGSDRYVLFYEHTFSGPTYDVAYLAAKSFLDDLSSSGLLLESGLAPLEHCCSCMVMALIKVEV